VVIPVNVAFGLKVITPVVVLIANVPGEVDNGTLTEAGFIGPPVSLHKTQIGTGVFNPVVVTSGLAIGGIPVTETVTFALVQLIGKYVQT
jgi:hypothetical protein